MLRRSDVAILSGIENPAPRNRVSRPTSQVPASKKTQAIRNTVIWKSYLTKRLSWTVFHLSELRGISPAVTPGPFARPSTHTPTIFLPFLWAGLLPPTTTTNTVTPSFPRNSQASAAWFTALNLPAPSSRSANFSIPGHPLEPITVPAQRRWQPNLSQRAQRSLEILGLRTSLTSFTRPRAHRYRTRSLTHKPGQHRWCWACWKRCCASTLVASGCGDHGV